MLGLRVTSVRAGESRSAGEGAVSTGAEREGGRLSREEKTTSGAEAEDAGESTLTDLIVKEDVSAVVE
jgi:hypothetical protein